MDVLGQTTAIIKTFERPASLELLLDSMREMYPKIRILVGDDSIGSHERETNEMMCERYKADYVPFPPDSGLSFGRNRLLERVTTPYFLLLDDDFVFTDKTRVEELVARVDKHDLDIVAGSVAMDGERRHYEAIFRQEGHTLHSVAEPLGKIEDVVLFELVFNFFAGRTSTVRSLGWTDTLKLAEHTDFFYRARGILRVGYFEDVEVNNSKAVPSELYQKMRGRGRTYAMRFMLTNNLRRLVNVHGEIFEL